MNNPNLAQRVQPDQVLAPHPTGSLRALILTLAGLACSVVLAAPMDLAAQQPASKVLVGGRVRSQEMAIPTPAPPPTAPASDPCKDLVDRLTSLRLEAAWKVKQIERVRLLDPALGAVMQVSLSDLNTRIKIAEIAVARCDERERDRRELMKLRLIQQHEEYMADKQHQNQTELLRIQQEQLRQAGPGLGALPAEKDFLELCADGLDASACLQRGVQQLKSKDPSVKADGLRQIDQSLRLASPNR